MQLYDILMIVVLVAAVLFGAWKGLAWQVASLSAIFVSYFVALTFRAPVAAMIKTEEPWNRFIAMFALFVLTSLGIWILFGFISRKIEKMQLKDFDRHAGAILGALKGALLCLVITFFAVTLLGNSVKQAICNSYSGRYIATAIDKMDAVMPKEVHDVVHPYLERLDKELDKEGNTDESETDNSTLFGLDSQTVTNGIESFGKQANQATQTNSNANPSIRSDIESAIDQIPVDVSKVDWRKIDWERAAKLIRDQAKEQR